LAQGVENMPIELTMFAGLRAILPSVMSLVLDFTVKCQVKLPCPINLKH